MKQQSGPKSRQIIAAAAALLLAACGGSDPEAGGRGGRGGQQGPTQVGYVVIQPGTAPIQQQLPGRVAAYQVSGEFAMVRAAAERGWIDGSAIAQESLLAIFRAGADVVLTYFARELAQAAS